MQHFGYYLAITVRSCQLPSWLFLKSAQSLSTCLGTYHDNYMSKNTQSVSQSPSTALSVLNGPYTAFRIPPSLEQRLPSRIGVQNLLNPATGETNSSQIPSLG